MWVVDTRNKIDRNHMYCDWWLGHITYPIHEFILLPEIVSSYRVDAACTLKWYPAFLHSCHYTQYSRSYTATAAALSKACVFNGKVVEAWLGGWIHAKGVYCDYHADTMVIAHFLSQTRDLASRRGLYVMSKDLHSQLVAFSRACGDILPRRKIRMTCLLSHAVVLNQIQLAK